MSGVAKRLWLAVSKLRFLLLPASRRVRLEVSVDGRHLTYLLTALGEAGYGVHVVKGEMVFRELLALRKSVDIPFVVGGKERRCALEISDRQSAWRVAGEDRDQRSEVGDQPERSADSVMRSRGQRSEVGDRKTEVGDQRSEVGDRRSVVRDASSSVNQRDGWSRCVGASVDRCNSRLEIEGQPRRVLMDYDYFSGLVAADAEGASVKPDTLDPSLATTPQAAFRMPYFMHPSVYHRGLHKAAAGGVKSDAWRVRGGVSGPARARRFRIGFFGTHDREFYTRNYHFPGMSRFEILEVLLARFGDRISMVSGSPETWSEAEIVVALDHRGGDKAGKEFLRQEDYFAALQECDFVLSPPGWCMPLSHNLVEIMLCGAIPITNASGFMAPPLEDGRTCLAFDDTRGFEATLNRALAMSPEEVATMRRAAMDYYDKFLEPSSFWGRLVPIANKTLLVNAEEKSVPLAFRLATNHSLPRRA